MLEGFKEMAAYVIQLRDEKFDADTVEKTADALRKAAHRPPTRNPLPVTFIGGRARANRRLIQAWNENEVGRRYPQATASALS